MSASRVWLSTFIRGSSSLASARVIGGEGRDLLIAQARRDAAHRGVLAGTRAVVLQSLDQVRTLLAAELRHRIHLRKGSAISCDAVTALAHGDIDGHLNCSVIRPDLRQTRNGQRGECQHARGLHSQYTNT